MPRDHALADILPPDLAAAVLEAVEAGEFASESRALESIVAAWHLERVERRIEDDELRRLVEEGIASGDPMDGDAFFDELEAELGARAAARSDAA